MPAPLLLARSSSRSRLGSILRGTLHISCDRTHPCARGQYRSSRLLQGSKRRASSGRECPLLLPSPSLAFSSDPSFLPTCFAPPHLCTLPPSPLEATERDLRHSSPPSLQKRKTFLSPLLQSSAFYTLPRCRPRQNRQQRYRSTDLHLLPPCSPPPLLRYLPPQRHLQTSRIPLPPPPPLPPLYQLRHVRPSAVLPAQPKAWGQS
mmetsp:Transcript_30348/g.78543  ORF Transcript_30348/g.78543 Transcript_30348/m.78543 type:complete len:205 (-) Transcript_30348:226-840(-)